MAFLEPIHLAATVLWGVAVLYLPRAMAVAIAAAEAGQARTRPVWMLYLAVIVPAGFVAVLSGITLHGQRPWTAPWPLVHVVVAGVLVWTLGATGFLLLKLERRQHRSLLSATRLVSGIALLFLLVFAGFGWVPVR